MKAYKKLLPKYWLGTRMPNSLGYQPNLGIGGVLYSSQYGERLEPEVKAAQANILPNALNRTQQSAAQIGNIWQHTGPTASSLALTNNAKQIGSALMSSANASDYATGWALKTAAENGKFAKTGLNAAGKALGVLGTVYGVGQGVSDWIHEGDHRSSSDMANALTTNTYTSDRGNSYKELVGFNRQAELAYERANRTSKNINNITNGIGTLGALGSVIGGLPGLFAGSAIGAGYGLLSAVLGFGDNEDEVKQNAINTENYMAMFNRLLKSASDSADVKDAFYSRDKAGVGQAAWGKKPVYDAYGITDEKQNAWGSAGETIVSKDGSSVQLPGRQYKNGKPNKDDDIKIKLKRSDAVLSNNGGSQYYQLTGDLLGALAIDEAYRLMFGKAEQKNMAKNGRLPKYDNGVGKYLLTGAPHLGAIFSNIAQYNRVKNSDRTVPNEDIVDFGANDVAAKMYADQLSGRELYDQNNRNFRQALWNIQRNPVLGPGGRAMFANDLAIKKSAEDTNIGLKLAESNRGQRNTARKLVFDNALNKMTLAHDSFWKRWNAAQLINSAYESYMSQFGKNIYNVGSALAKDINNNINFDRSYALLNEMLKLWGIQADTDRMKALNGWYWNPTNVLREQQLEENPLFIHGRRGEAARKALNRTGGIA